MISKFDREVAKKLRDEINSAVAVVAKKFGIELQVGNCSFSETEMTYKLNAKVTDTDVLQEKKTEEWGRYCELYGFKKDDLGKTFMVRGEAYKVAGFNLKRSKYDLQGERLKDGKTFLFVSDEISKKLHPESKKMAYSLRDDLHGELADER